MNHELYLQLYGPESLNHRLFMLLNHAANPLLDVIAPLFTTLGGSWAVYVYIPLLLAISILDRDLMPRRTVWLYCLATVLGILCEELLKDLLQVPRPAVAVGLGQIRVVGAAKFGNSLPSGHAIFSFVTAYMLGYQRSWRWRSPLYLCAVLVCWSRVYVGAHYPLDVTAGAVVGTGVGFLVWKGYERLSARRDTTGRSTVDAPPCSGCNDNHDR